MQSEENALQNWQDSIIPHEFEPTENMMIWMSGYVTPCKRLCCLSEDCACIKCSHCGEKLTTVPPLPRFECCDCEWIGSEIKEYEDLAERLRSTFADPRPTFCENCFANSDVLHHHERFVAVDSDGTHSLITRSIGILPQSELQISDFPIISDSWPEGKVCQSYCCDNEDPPVAPPGCTKGHGLPLKGDKNLGAIDTNEFMCAPCSYQFLKISGAYKFSGEIRIGQFCAVCAQELQTESFAEEFQEAKSYILENLERPAAEIFETLNSRLATKVSSAEATISAGEKGRIELLKKHLKKLHPQPWLHREIEIL